MKQAIVCLLVAGSWNISTATAEDWPCFFGPNHNGTSDETGFITDWGDDGPPRLWAREVGRAFSSFAVVDGRLFTCGQEDKQQVLFCMDAQTGRIIWKKPFEAQVTDPDDNVYGTRATPTVDEGRVFILGGYGRLLCCEVRDGSEIWSRQLTRQPPWGYAGSVLIENEKAIITGGDTDGSLLAVDKRTGKTLWTCGTDPAAYATPMAFTFQGRRYVCGFMAESFLVGDMETGRQVLRVKWPSHSGVNVSTPIYHDGHLLVSTGYGFGSGLFKLREEGAGLAAVQVWKSAKLRNKLQTPILHEGKLYSSDETDLKCVDFLSGEILWRKRDIAHGTMILADGWLILFTEKGGLYLARPSTSEFKPAAKAKPFEGSSYNLLTRKQGARCWSMPVLSNHLLYVRSHDTVVCLDLRQQKPKS